MTHYPVTIERIERARNSTYGNPRWYLYTNRGKFHTAPDVAFAYVIDNKDWSRRNLTFVMNGWGKVVEIFLESGERL